MRHKRLKLSAVLLLGLTGLQAQESINATGSNASDGGGSVSYSVGQVVYTINAGTDGSVAQGVQQPFEISIVTAIEEAKGINLSVTAYPNPASDYLTLSIDENVQTRHALSQHTLSQHALSQHALSQLSFQLYDINGKLLQDEKITGNQTSIVMSNLVPAIYFVKIIVQTQGLAPQEVKTFKIIKN